MWSKNIILVVCGAAVSAAGAGPSANLIDDLAGIYRVPATRCSAMLEHGLVSCEKEVEDCLTIRKESENSAWIQFSSVQTNGHNCSDEGIAHLVDGALVYCPEGEDYEGQCVRIEVTDDTLLMKRVGSEDARDAFCGSRATVTGLAFPRKVRAEVAACE